MRIRNFRYRNTFGSRWIYLLYGNFEKLVTLVTLSGLISPAEIKEIAEGLARRPKGKSNVSFGECRWDYHAQPKFPLFLLFLRDKINFYGGFAGGSWGSRWCRIPRRRRYAFSSRWKRGRLASRVLQMPYRMSRIVAGCSITNIFGEWLECSCLDGSGAYTDA